MALAMPYRNQYGQIQSYMNAARLDCKSELVLLLLLIDWVRVQPVETVTARACAAAKAGEGVTVPPLPVDVSPREP